MVQQEKSHQHHQAAKDRHRKVSIRRPQRICLFVMRHPHIGSKGHDFKEDKRSIQIRRQEHAHRGSKRHQQKEIIPVPVPVMGKIFFGKQRRQQPHKRSDESVQHTEPVQGKMKPKTAEPSDSPINRITRQVPRSHRHAVHPSGSAKICRGYIQHRRKLNHRHGIRRIIPRRLILPSD